MITPISDIYPGSLAPAAPSVMKARPGYEPHQARGRGEPETDIHPDTRTSKGTLPLRKGVVKTVPPHPCVFGLGKSRGISGGEEIRRKKRHHRITFIFHCYHFTSFAVRRHDSFILRNHLSSHIFISISYRPTGGGEGAIERCVAARIATGVTD